MINVNKKYFDSVINKNPKPIIEGDTVKFSLMRKLDSDKALVNVMGNKIVAQFKNGITEKGFALVSKENDKIILTVLKNANGVKKNSEKVSYAKNGISVNISDNGMENSRAAIMLSSKGAKVTNQNIRYLETVLKYLPNLDKDKKNFFINSTANEIYFGEEELKNFGNIFNKLAKLDSVIKNSNKNGKTTEILLTLFNKIVSDSGNYKNYIGSNGYFGLWFILFDALKNELSYESSEAILLILKILSSNRRNKNSKDINYLIPMPFIIDGETRELSLYICEYKGAYKYIFTAYDEDGKELCDVIIEKNEDEYLIIVKLFDKNLYDKCEETKGIIDNELKAFDNLKLKTEYLYEKRQRH